MPRMNILNKSEQAMFNRPPVFNSGESKRFFNFPNSLTEKTETLRKLLTRIGFLLAFGYFKSSNFSGPKIFTKMILLMLPIKLALTPASFRQSYMSLERGSGMNKIYWISMVTNALMKRACKSLIKRLH